MNRAFCINPTLFLVASLFSETNFPAVFPNTITFLNKKAFHLIVIKGFCALE